MLELNVQFIPANLQLVPTQIHILRIVIGGSNSPGLVRRGGMGPSEYKRSILNLEQIPMRRREVGLPDAIENSPDEKTPFSMAPTCL